MTRDVVEANLRRLAVLRPGEAEGLWRVFVASEGEERAAAADLLDVVVWQALAKDFREQLWLPPPSREVCAGEYGVGTVLYPGRVPFGPMGLREADWIRHVLIVGMTGAGKTHLAFHLVHLLRAAGKPFLILDWKRNYRDLRQLPELADLAVFTVGRDVVPFRFNPLIPPPGVLVGEWLVKLVDVLKHAYFVGEGVEFVLRRALDYVYDMSGLLEGRVDEVPTFAAVRAFVEQQRLVGRMSLWKASALRVLDSLCFRHGLGPVMNGAAGDLEGLLARSVVLELDALADADKTFVAEALILWIYEYRKRHARREAFQHALVIEEAHHILSAAKERHAGVETIMETCLRQIREFGEAVIVIDQEPSKLSHSIKANTATKISFALGTGRDVADLAPSLGLDPQTAPWLHRLPVGHGIVVVRPRLSVPTLVRFPFLPIVKGFIADDRIGTTLVGQRSPSYLPVAGRDSA